MKDYTSLQNGSDVRGTALEVEGGKPVNLSLEAARDIGFAFARWLSEQTGKPANELRVAIGRDSRLTGPSLAKALAAGLIAFGAAAEIAGLASTPAMFMCCAEGVYDGGIMVTASHLPFERNGAKFFTKRSGLEKADVKKILAYAAEVPDDMGVPDIGGEFVSCDVMTPYIEGLKGKILAALSLPCDAKPFSGMRIIVDAGNGAGGFFAARLLSPLGADTAGSLYLEPDGHFPNHQPNPENAEAMASITNAVIETGADMGIIFDTDVDRAGAVLPDGKGSAVALDRNRLIALMTAILRDQYGPITVVTDSITSTGLAEFIEGLGCRHHRFKRGYRNVINEAIRLMGEGENAIFAMETSGHGALRENYFLDDGAYVIVKLLVELVRSKAEGRSPLDLIASLREPAESAEARLPVLCPDFGPVTEKVLETVTEYFGSREGFSIVPNNYEGVRVNADKAHGDGWFLIRRSLHDPLMPTNIESDAEGGVRLIAASLLECLKSFGELDLTPLEKTAE
ncbi:MAG: phosphomannomutase/phosphoglucomutase [Clostridiales bacterium]|nr:phosphomannomutase/phosphoglucomutase [Clostridiales bacterium]